LKIGDVDIDEEIDSYFKSLDTGDRKWSLKEEENCRKYGIKIIPDRSYEKLQKLPDHADGNHLEGVHTYDILANPLYLDDFQYISASLENRDEYIIDDDDDEDNDAVQSDLVRVALNLAYLSEDKAKAFDFNKNSFCSNFKSDSN